MSTTNPTHLRRTASLLLAALALFLGPLHGPRAALAQHAETAAPPTSPPANGISNYHRIDAVFACGGAITDEGIAQLQREGVRAVVNLRETSEPDANVEAEGEAVRRAGMTYLHIPLNDKAPTAEPFDRFLAALDDPANQPLYLHCRSGNRAAAVWMAKRVLRDGWPVEKAEEEAVALGLKNPALKQFVIDYTQQRRK